MWFRDNVVIHAEKKCTLSEIPWLMLLKKQQIFAWLCVLRFTIILS